MRGVRVVDEEGARIVGLTEGRRETQGLGI